MIIGVGLEMADIPPLQAWSEGEGATDGGEYGGIFSHGELAYVRTKRRAGEHLAARLAAKRALLKSAGRGPEGVALDGIWIDRAPSGKPSIHVDPDLGASLGLLPGDRLHVTLSHTGDVAVALVVWERLPGAEGSAPA